MYAEYLKVAACEVDEAADGTEALAKATASLPDVVITETRLSGISGYELCARLRREPATAAVTIVVVTADGYAADIERALSAGADSVLVKPCLPDQLAAELRRLLRRSPRQRQPNSKAPFTKALKAATPEQHYATASPPFPPPELKCPLCDATLAYRQSRVARRNRRDEQWDYFECVNGCGLFRYFQRTRRFSRVS
jgi:two-component system phosphate regulon response regulator PhoB